MGRPRQCFRFLLVGFSLPALLLVPGPGLIAQNADHWVGTWATAVVSRDPHPVPTPLPQAPQPAGSTVPTNQTSAAPPSPAPVNLRDQTIRQIVHTSIGGDRIRVVFSNVFGTAGLAIGAAHVAIRDKGAAIVSTSDHPLTFNGHSSISIPAGATIVSDPVALSLAPLADLAIDLYLPGDTGSGSSPLTLHGGALQTNYISPNGNHVGKKELPIDATTSSWFFLARVEVAAPRDAGAVVTIGDSITDGSRSTPDSNHRWPDQLARRLVSAHMPLGVLNVGIGGNRLLLDGTGPNALARFDRDVLLQTGITHIVVLEGINDIRHTEPAVTAVDLITAHQQLVERAHAWGLRIYGAVLTPFEGSLYTAENEAKRQALISWMRSSKAYDGIIDFDVVVRDAGHLQRLAPQFDSGDHIHPNDAGYVAMGDAIDLELFKERKRPSKSTR